MSRPDESTLLKAIDRLVQRPTSYTRTYYYWKKFQNISCFFKKELKVKKGLIKVIEVGCGLGPYIFRLNKNFGKENNLEFQGVDLDSTSIYYCNSKREEYQTKNITFSVDNAEHLNLAANSFDILLSVEVLEHLKEPKRAIKEFYRILKPGGLAIITTPNGSTLVSKLKKILRFLYPKLWKTEDLLLKEAEGLNSATLDANHRQVTYGHISVKGLNEWIRILRESGFKIEEIGRGSLLAGTSQQDKRRAIFALALLAEILLDKLPLFKNLSEDVIISSRKV